MGRFLAGILATVVVAAILGYGAVRFGYVPARADEKPGSLERLAARMALNATIAREQPQPPYPYGPPTDATLLAGAKLYIQNCAFCHGTGKTKDSPTAVGMNVSPPQFSKNGVDDDPAGTNYWKIEHGIRFTGMPSYAKTLTEEQVWQLAYFVTHGMDKLPPAAAAVWNETAPAN